MLRSTTHHGKSAEARERADRERERVNLAEAKQALTTLEHYLKLVQQRLFQRLSLV